MNKIKFKNNYYKTSRVLEKLTPFLTERRLEKMDQVLKERSHHFVPVLEDLYDRGNVSAVMRSSEAFGFYKMHIIQKNDSFKESKRVTQGADKWLEVQKWSETKSCIEDLKSKGYRVYTTSLEDEAQSIFDLDFEQKTALILGNEKIGVSQEAKSLSDGNVLLPMSGFTQSFNISVAAALCFLAAKSKSPPCLSDLEKRPLKALYMLKTLDWSEKALNSMLQSEG